MEGCPQKAIRVRTETRGYRGCTVLGGAGMLGFEIVRQLLAAGQEGACPGPARAARAGLRAGDRRHPRPAALRKACAGAQVVFQTAAAVWDPVTHGRDLRGGERRGQPSGDRGLPRAGHPAPGLHQHPGRGGGRADAHRGRRRIPAVPAQAAARRLLADQDPRRAAGAARPTAPGLATCALRPVGMYGPRDRYHLGNFVAMARKGVSLRLGDGSARFSHVYSENAAHAHLLAAERLWPGSGAAGQCYFVCDHYPAGNIFDFMAPYLQALGLPVPRRAIPYRLAYLLAAAAEIVAPRSHLQPLRRGPDLRRPHLRARQGCSGAGLHSHGLARGGLRPLAGLAAREADPGPRPGRSGLRTEERSELDGALIIG